MTLTLDEQFKALDEKLERLLAAEDSYCASYKLYKGAGGKYGAFQLDMTPLHRSKKDLGAVFIQMAPVAGKNDYDWDNKITFACGLSDIAKILETITNPPAPDAEPVSIFHDTHAGTERKGELTKSLLINRGKTGYGFYFTLYQNEGQNKRSVSIPISDGEALIMKALLERASCRILAW